MDVRSPAWAGFELTRILTVLGEKSGLEARAGFAAESARRGRRDALFALAIGTVGADAYNTVREQSLEHTKMHKSASAKATARHC